MKGLSEQELKAVRTLKGAEIARMVYIAVESGSRQARLAEVMGVSRQRVNTLYAKGAGLIAEEKAATEGLMALYGGGT